MILTVDVGNRSTKMLIWETEPGPQPIKGASVPDVPDVDTITTFIGTASIRGIAMSNVSGKEMPLEYLSTIAPIVEVTAANPAPIEIDYDTPGTLGADRIAAAVGAMRLFEAPLAQNLLVVDLGTAATYDVVSRTRFLGGNIAPGIGLRLDALHNCTGRLPQVPTNTPVKPGFFGTDTKSAILKGCVQGVLGEIEYYANRASNMLQDQVTTVITGADAQLVMQSADAPLSCPVIHYEPLVALGLLTIFQYNEKKN